MDAKIFLTREKAATLYSIIHLMTNGVAYRAKREEVQKKLAKAWPEILESTPAEPSKVKREITLDAREQKAMGEGLLELVTRDKANGADYANCLELAGTLRISAWYRKATTVQEVPENEEPLDDEEVPDPDFEVVE